MIDLSVFLGLAKIDLGALADKPTALVPGQQEAATSLWTSPDGALDIGVWECTPGRFAADRSAAAEFCYFPAGPDRDDPYRRHGANLRPGRCDHAAARLEGAWKIVEHTRKIYVFLTDPVQG